MGRHHLRLGALLTAGAMLLVACGGSTSPTSSGSKTPETVKLGQATVAGKKKQVLTNDSGRTLYYLTGSTAANLECTGSCAQIWPPLLLKAGQPAAPKGITGLAVATTKDGRMVLFRGHPLFLFAQDTGAGMAKGDGIEKAAGQVWHVVTTSLKAATGGSTSPNSTGSGSGYNY